MLGIVSWLGCGVLFGIIVSKLISGADKGIFFLTVAVGGGGAIAGGVLASYCGYGNIATFSMYAMLFAAVGAAITLLTFTRFVEF